MVGIHAPFGVPDGLLLLMEQREPVTVRPVLQLHAVISSITEPFTTLASVRAMLERGENTKF